jgi:hypothetical protein
MKWLKKMASTILFVFLLLIQNWIDWVESNPIAQSIIWLIFFCTFGLVNYFICIPFMMGKLEERIQVRDEEQDEW